MYSQSLLPPCPIHWGRCQRAWVPVGLTHLPPPARPPTSLIPLGLELVVASAGQGKCGFNPPASHMVGVRGSECEGGHGWVKPLGSEVAVEGASRVPPFPGPSLKLGPGTPMLPGPTLGSGPSVSDSIPTTNPSSSSSSLFCLLPRDKSNTKWEKSTDKGRKPSLFTDFTPTCSFGDPTCKLLESTLEVPFS